MSTVIEDISMKAIDLFAGAGGFTIGAEAIHMLGNAVCPPVATAIINELRRVA